MIKISVNETTENLNVLEKKEWITPQMTKLHIKETKSGTLINAPEAGLFEAFLYS